VKMTAMEGLIPGTMGNVTALNPFAMMQSFLSGGVPDCKATTLQVVDNNGNKTNETHYLTVVDINNLEEGFENITSYKKKQVMLPPDNLMQFFFLGLSILGVYILYKIMMRTTR